MYNLKQLLIEIKLCVDNEWLDKYCELINNNYNTESIKFKTQIHHIIPRYYYKSINESINNNSDNLVNLFHKDHVLAHYYLSLCSFSEEFQACNIWSIKHVLSNQIYMQQDEWKTEKLLIEQLDNYQQLIELERVYTGNVHRGKQESLETRKKKSMSHKGMKYKQMSDEGRKNISQGKIGKTHIVYNSTKEKISKTRKNLQLVNIHKDGIRKSVRKTELQDWLDKGYVLGWPSLSDYEKRCWINNGFETKSIFVKDLDQYFGNGWVAGRLPFFSDDARERQKIRVKSQDWKNIIWVTNGQITKRVQKDQIPEGFIPGRKLDK